MTGIAAFVVLVGLSLAGWLLWLDVRDAFRTRAARRRRQMRGW